MAGKGLCGMTLLLAMAAVTGCRAERPKEEVKRNGEDSAFARDQDMLARVEVVKVETGEVCGFRIEVINLSKDKYCVLPAPIVVSILLFNEEGWCVTPVPQPESVNREGDGMPMTVHLYTISPRSGQTCYVPVPAESQVNYRDIDDDKVQPTPKGTYQARIAVTCQYRLQDRDADPLPAEPPFKWLQLAFPKIRVFVDPDKLKRDVLETHLKRGSH